MRAAACVAALLCARGLGLAQAGSDAPRRDKPAFARLGAGWIEAPYGQLGSPVLDLSMVFAFDVTVRP